MRIGVISDTHGKVLPEVHDAFADVSLILHAGDIGGEAVIAELETIARVVAVRGNTDRDLTPPRFPDTRRFTLDEVEIFLCHEPYRAAGLSPVPDLIIHGHTHLPKIMWEDRTLWFNPGTASKPQFGQHEYTVGILNLHEGQIDAEIIRLR